MKIEINKENHKYVAEFSRFLTELANEQYNKGLDVAVWAINDLIDEENVVLNDKTLVKLLEKIVNQRREEDNA